MTYWRPYNKTIYYNPTAYSFQTTRSRSTSNQVYIDPKLLNQYWNFMIKNQYKPLTDMIDETVDEIEKKYQISSVIVTLMNDTTNSKLYNSISAIKDFDTVYKVMLMRDSSGLRLHSYSNHELVPFYYYVKKYIDIASSSIMYYGFWPILVTAPEGSNSNFLHFNDFGSIGIPPYFLEKYDDLTIVLKSKQTYPEESVKIATYYNLSLTTYGNANPSLGPFYTDNTLSDQFYALPSDPGDATRIDIVVFQPIFIRQDIINSYLVQIIEGPLQSTFSNEELITDD